MLLQLLLACLFDEATYLARKAALTDNDGDGFVNEDDCDDSRVDVFPGATELCNATDDDCDGEIDDDAADALLWYLDADSDGVGAAGGGTESGCEQPSGYANSGVDCDDSRADTYPGAVEVPYDGLDQDCSGDDLSDLDGDGAEGLPGGGDDCDDLDALVLPGGQETWQNGATDNDCDGMLGAASLEYGQPQWSAAVAAGQAGRRVEPIGDVDGDGWAEVLVAAPYDGTDAEFGGAVHILGDDGFGQLVAKNSAVGAAAYGFLGASVGAAGDVDQDGLPDFLVSATGTSNGTGTTWLVPSAALPATGAFSVESASLLSIEGEEENSFAGSAASLVGDLNGDGASDFGVGSPLRGGETGVNVGAIALFSAADRGARSLTDALALLTGSYPGAGLGNRVFGLGDVDDDGHDDFAVAAGYGDAGYIVSGLPADGDITAMARVRITGDESDTLRDLWSAGDLDGDGRTDLVVLEDSRFVRLFTDVAAGPTMGVGDWNHSVDGGQFVYQPHALGDLDGDGLGELLVPSIYDATYASPVAGLFFGADWSFRELKMLDDATLLAISTRGNAAGYRVATPGDVDGDAVDDIALGAYADAEGGTDAGGVILLPMPN